MTRRDALSCFGQFPIAYSLNSIGLYAVTIKLADKKGLISYEFNDNVN